MHYLEPILNFASQHAGLAYLTVFLAALAESLTLASLVVPGSIIVFAFGAVAASGHLSLIPALLMAIAGAIAGDGLSYWLGYHYKDQLRSHWPFSHYPELLSNGEAFFIRHGRKSVFLGHFVGIMRSVVPMVAGMMGIKPLYFFTANALSAIGWGLLHVLPGVVFGVSLAMAGSVSARLAVLALLLGFGVWAFFWLWHRILFIAVQFGKKWLLDLRRWAEARPASHGLVRLGQGFVSRIFSLGQTAGLLAAILGILLLATASGFATVAHDVLAKDSLVLMDQSVYHFFQGLRTTWTDTIFITITELGDSFVNTTLVIAILVLLLTLRLRRTALFWLLTTAGGSIGMQFLKWIFHLPRPTNLYEGISSYSFPSGHTTMSVVIYGFLAIILARNLAGIKQWLLFSTVLIIAFFIGFSRIYLGAHWFSDVLAGSLVGTSWIALMGIVWLQGKPERMPRRFLVLTVLLVHCTAGAWHVIQRHQHDIRLYTPRLAEKSMELNAWLQSGWQHLPAARVDFGTRAEQPLNIQWVARPKEIRALLSSEGWRQPSLRAHDFLALFDAKTPIAQLPVLPRLHEGRREALVLVQDRPENRLVLRLWAEAITVSPGHTPLLTGFIEEQHSKSLGWLRSFPVASGRHEKGRQLLAQNLSKKTPIKEAQRSVNSAVAIRNNGEADWQGTVLLVWPPAP